MLWWYWAEPLNWMWLFLFNNNIFIVMVTSCLPGTILVIWNWYIIYIDIVSIRFAVLMQMSWSHNCVSYYCIYFNTIVGMNWILSLDGMMLFMWLCKPGYDITVLSFLMNFQKEKTTVTLFTQTGVDTQVSFGELASNCAHRMKHA